MPYVTVKMLEGRTEEQKKALAEKVTAAVSETTGAPEENIVVFIEEMSKTIMQLAENANFQVFHKKQPLAASYFFPSNNSIILSLYFPFLPSS